MIGQWRMFDARPNYTYGPLGWFGKGEASSHDQRTFNEIIKKNMNFEKLNEMRHEKVANMRPWLGEFFNRNQFTTPDGISTVQNRLSSNWGYFQSNYMVITLLLLIYAVYIIRWVVG